MARRTSLRGNLSASEGAAYCCRLILCHPTNHIVCVGAAPFYRATAPRCLAIYLLDWKDENKKSSKWKYGEKKISRFEMKPLTSLFFAFCQKDYGCRFLNLAKYSVIESMEYIVEFKI